MVKTLALDEMTIAEKLPLLEELWEDLSRDADALPAPGWHEEELTGREHRIRSGAASFVDWAEAKDRIRDRLK